MDVLSRVMLLRNVLEQDSSVRLLVDFDFGGCFRNTWLLPLLKKLGVHEERVIRYDPANIYSAGEVYLPGPIRCGLPAQSWLLQLRRCLALPDIDERQGDKILFLSRQGTGLREILNHAEVFRELGNRLGPASVVDVDAMTRTVDQQIELFGQARAIVGIHGAALVNMLFAPRDCLIIEVLPRDYADAGVFWSQSNALGMLHRICVVPSSGVDDRVTLDAHRFASFVADALGNENE